ncbi:ribbon-helix-helix protein, CopG family [Hyperthermus butylicus]|uniref:ribbon-helix-helix protein, CopG family n=1 Tax=Hyperthermus butylicus TaxID=54248 RepID=UPI003B833276
MLEEEYARRLEEIAKRKGITIGEALEEALKTLLIGEPSTSSQALYSSLRGGRIQGIACH